MGALDKIKAKGPYRATNFTYIDKLVENDATLVVKEMKLKVSEKEATEGNEVFVAVFEVAEDRLGSMELSAEGTISLSTDLDAGSGTFQKKKFEEVAELVAVATGTPLSELFNDPTKLRELLADSEAYAGTRIVVGSKAPKGGFYNLRWSTESDYIAKQAELAAIAARRPAQAARPAARPAAEDEDEAPAPKSAKRPAKGGKRANEDDSL